MFKNLLTLILVLFSNTTYADNLYIFTAKWCGPCNELKYFLSEDKDVQSWFAISMIDIEDYPEIAKDFNIKSVPTSIIIKDKEEIERITGYNRLYKRKLRNHIERKK